jgi:hypothetical protein
MRLSPPCRCRLLLAAALLATMNPGAAASEGPNWTLEQHGRTYTYTVTLSTTLPEPVVLDVLFSPRHVAVFSRSAGRLAVIREDEAVNEVRFDTRRLIFTCSTTFRRTLDRTSGSIEIEMLTFRATWGRLAPHARSSRARYTVTDCGSRREVVYRQEVETDRRVSGYSLRVVRKSIEAFSRDLYEYLQRPDLGRDAGSAAAPAAGGEP